MGKSYNAYISAHAVCPFYMGENAMVIRCEGAIDGSVLGNSFGRREDKERWASAHCRSMDGYRECPICMLMQEKWAGR